MTHLKAVALILICTLGVACDELPSNTVADSGTTGGNTETDSGVIEDAGTTPDSGTTEEDAGSEIDAGTDTDAGMEVDAGTETDAGMSDGGPVGITCGSSFCTGGDICCGETDGVTSTTYCAPSCSFDGGAGLTLNCDDQTDCGGGELCCATLDLAQGGFPCPLAGGEAVCSNSCSTSIPFSCGAQATVVLCQTSAECASQQLNPQCCGFGISGVSTQFCTNDFWKQQLNSTGCVP